MSIALICDRCGNTFAEGEEGSFSGSGNVNIRTGSGRMGVDTRRIDVCGVCNGGGVSTVGRREIESNKNGG